MVSRCRDIIASSILPLFFFLFFDTFPSPLASSETAAAHLPRLREELEKLKTRMEKINRTAIKTIQSPDGDILDCVLSNQQPAFDHPLLKGKKPLEPSERPRGHGTGSVAEDFQLWAGKGGACPEGTIPIRRTTEADIMRSSDATMFGRKARRGIRRDTSSYGHEHAVALTVGGQFYGAKASINVWSPSVTSSGEFSLSQIWVTSGSFGTDLNTIEAGWQVSPELYGDNLPRFFTYWTTDAYQETGCYNLLCSGFVQTNRRIAMGAAISPSSSYRGGQFDISLLVWKDPRHGNWWLELGSGIMVGYWPAILFSRLKERATMVQFGGEVVNKAVAGSHTSTQMGSGHFAGEGFGKAAYFRNMEVVDWGNSLIPVPNLKLVADHPLCYDVAAGTNPAWGSYFFYGGPGRNLRCP